MTPAVRKTTVPTALSSAAASPLRGILFLIASTIVFSVADVITKQLASTLPPPEVAWMRYVTFALVIIPVVLLKGGPTLFRSQRPGLQVVRGLGMVGSSIWRGGAGRVRPCRQWRRARGGSSPRPGDPPDQE